MALANIVFWHRPLLLALGRPDLPLRIQLIVALGKALLALLLIPRLGFVGAAWALSAAYIGGALASTAAALGCLRDERLRGAGV